MPIPAQPSDPFCLNNQQVDEEVDRHQSSDILDSNRRQCNVLLMRTLPSARPWNQA